MKDKILKFLQYIYDYGYEAYVVGGYVRDSLLDIESSDIDITTNATPMELKNIFPDIKISQDTYGSGSLIFDKVKYEITTYRKDSNYSDNRHPSEIKYINSLFEDLKRRDFTINTICLDKDGNIVDLLNGINDLKKKIIVTVEDPDISFKEDSLRILRAIRFATLLEFEISNKVKESIKKNKELLKDLSYTRKKEELDRIFTSKNVMNGITLLKELDLLDVLEINNLDRVKDYSDINGIWAMINPKNYTFNNSLKEIIEKTNIVYEKDNLDKFVLYEYGLYVNVLAGINKGLSNKSINEVYVNMPIHNRSEIDIDGTIISNTLNRKPGSYINVIYKDLENKILNNELENNKDKIIEYISNNYN